MVNRLAVFGAVPFGVEAARAVLVANSSHEDNKNEHGKEDPSSVLEGMVARGELRRFGLDRFVLVEQDQRQGPQSAIPKSAQQQLRAYIAHYVDRLRVAGELYYSPRYAEGLAMVDVDRGHFDRVLLHVPWTRDEAVALVGALALNFGLLNLRWTDAEVDCVALRVLAALELGTEGNDGQQDGKGPGNGHYNCDKSNSTWHLRAWGLRSLDNDAAVALVQQQQQQQIVPAQDAHPRKNDTDCDLNCTVTKLLVAAAVWNQRGILLSSREAYETALGIYSNVVGPRHHRTATVLNNLGSLLNSLEHHLAALSIRVAVLGPRHPSLVASYSNVGVLYDEQLKDYDRALDYYHRALDVLPQASTAALLLHNIATIHDRKGDYDTAIDYSHKVLAIHEAALGSNHADTGTAYVNMGMVYTRKGDHAMALQCFNRALAIRVAVLGPDSPEAGSLHYWIACAAEAVGDIASSYDSFHRSMAFREANLDHNHPDAGRFFFVSGQVFAYKCAYDMALQYHEKALAIRERILGDDHVDTAASMRAVSVTRMLRDSLGVE